MVSRTSDWVGPGGESLALCAVSGRGVFGDWIDPAGPDGFPAGDCAKRTQFAVGGPTSGTDHAKRTQFGGGPGLAASCYGGRSGAGLLVMRRKSDFESVFY